MLVGAGGAEYAARLGLPAAGGRRRRQATRPVAAVFGGGGGGGERGPRGGGGGRSGGRGWTIRATVGAVVVDAAGRLTASASSGGACVRPAGRLGAAAVPPARPLPSTQRALPPPSRRVWGERGWWAERPPRRWRALWEGGCPLAAAAAAEAGAGQKAPTDPGGGDGGDEGDGGIDPATLVRLSAAAGGGGGAGGRLLVSGAAPKSPGRTRHPALRSAIGR
ncbi:hypothetical protein BU14_0056s0030 [Porphyra umbilicalis]|uniref:Asparaginase n=1 Tax=Porphyra umbilicalis TaxID=2786 RepID=A0A1X6PHE4_PORUM|nr:hypothetical protein BU14_0056s0030 [Porphyra umbilicalis]|eukprot:OSX80247.1 hypothetical protein BU14_0056s0030 [Porphyra umbilicalis]